MPLRVSLGRLNDAIPIECRWLESNGAGVAPADRASPLRSAVGSLDYAGQTPADAAGTAAPLASGEEKITAAIRGLAAKMPTYITLKDVKKRWGHGQEDIFPVTQFEKLWGDMTALAEIESKFVVVPRLRGQQLKDQAQLDGWLRDGSAAHVESLCQWK